MKKLEILLPLIVIVFLMVLAGPSTVKAGPVSSAGAANKSFTLSEVKKARASLKKPELVLSWETKVKLANDALARDAATVKSNVDGILQRANQKYIDCAAKDYTLQELQGLCKPNEGVKECIDRLVMNCMVGQSAQQMANSLADAMAVTTVQSALNRLKEDITNLENVLFK